MSLFLALLASATASISDSANSYQQTIMAELNSTSPDLLPLRMLNEYAYCPRLFHFMHIEGRWADNEYTIDGRHAHRRVDALDHLLPGAPVGSKDEGGKLKDESAQTPVAGGAVPVGEDPPRV